MSLAWVPHAADTMYQWKVKFTLAINEYAYMHAHTWSDMKLIVLWKLKLSFDKRYFCLINDAFHLLIRYYGPAGAHFSG